MNRVYLLGSFCCFFAAFVWGMLYPIIYKALFYMDALILTSLRCLMSALILVICLLVIEGKKAFKLKFKDIMLLWFFGSLGIPCCFFLAAYAQYLIGLDGSLNIALVMASSPLISLILISIIRRKRPSFFTILCVLVSFIGILLVITKGSLSNLLGVSGKPFANILIILSMLSFVTYTIGATIFKNISSLGYTTITAILSLSTTAVLEIFFIQLGLSKIPSVDSIIKVMPYLLYMTIFAGVLAYLLWNYGNKILSPINGILFLNIEPIATVILLVFFASFPSKIQLIGMAITITALICNNLIQRKQVLPIK